MLESIRRTPEPSKSRECRKGCQQRTSAPMDHPGLDMSVDGGRGLGFRPPLSRGLGRTDEDRGQQGDSGETLPSHWSEGVPVGETQGGTGGPRSTLGVGPEGVGPVTAGGTERTTDVRRPSATPTGSTHRSPSGSGVPGVNGDPTGEGGVKISGTPPETSSTPCVTPTPTCRGFEGVRNCLRRSHFNESTETRPCPYFGYLGLKSPSSETPPYSWLPTRDDYRPTDAPCTVRSTGTTDPTPHSLVPT